MMGAKRRQINTGMLDSVTPEMLGADLLGADPLERLHEEGLRVEPILLDLVRPDPAQPRRVLPARIYHSFHDNRLTPTQALRELVQVAQIAARQRGRPFDGLLDLLSGSDNEEGDQQLTLSPEEELLRDLVNLAVTIHDDGQVNPLTVVDMTKGVTRLYRIETGERRYWATWLLRDFLPGYESDGAIPCIIIPSGRASPFRQAKENTARAGLSAIAMARQAALLLLTVHGHEFPEGPVTNDFYRQALELDLRGKREYTAGILAAMGGISKMRFSQHKTLLKLSDEAVELADRHNIDEKKLRYVVTLPEELHVELVRQIIDFNLTSKQVKEICETDPDAEATPDETSSSAIPRQAMKMARITRASADTTGQDLARALLKQERDVHLARARLQTLRQLIDEAEQHLEDG